jgi:RNA polymerase-binding transcription factor DksA
MTADVIDQASDFEHAINEAAVAAARLKSKPEQVQNADGSWLTQECVDCGDIIPPQRLALGRVRCFYCQSELEKKGRN